MICSNGICLHLHLGVSSPSRVDALELAKSWALQDPFCGMFLAGTGSNIS